MGSPADASTSANPGAGHPLVSTAVREQRIIGPAGAEDIRRTVYCTVRGQSVPVAGCQWCALRERVTIDPAGRHSEVICAMPSPARTDLEGDALQWHAPVSALMTTRVICVRSTLPVRAVLMVLVEHSISGVPVVDAAGRLVGMVSFTDLMGEQYDQIENKEDELLPHFARAAVERNGADARADAPVARTAEDIMTPSVFSVREEARVCDAALEMSRRHVHRVPVLSRDGAVVGMVSALDVVRWMAAGPPGREAET